MTMLAAIERVSILRVLVAFAAAMVVFAVTHFAPVPGGLRELLDATNGQPILDLKPSFSANETHERIGQFSENAQDLYRRFTITTDVIFPVTLTWFLVLFARFSASTAALPKVAGLAIIALPFVFFVADMIENASIFALLSDYPARHEFIEGRVGYVTVVKRSAMYASFLFPALLLAASFLMGALGRTNGRDRGA